MLVSRSGVDMLRSLKQTTAVVGIRTESMISWVVGVTAGLLFAFSPVLWSQATIVEVYGLNAFFMVLTVLLMYRWMCRPDEDHTLYTTAFVFGLGLTNHQTLLFMAPALLTAIVVPRPTPVPRQPRRRLLAGGRHPVLQGVQDGRTSPRRRRCATSRA
jgi:hypothetical protein